MTATATPPRRFVGLALALLVAASALAAEPANPRHYATAHRVLDAV